jgi:hypothetical protein
MLSDFPLYTGRYDLPGIGLNEERFQKNGEC